MNAARALVLLGDFHPLPVRVRLESVAAVYGVWARADDSGDHYLVTVDAPAE